LRKIDETVGELLIFESGDDPPREIEAIARGTHLGHYHRIATTYGTGKVRELGFFQTRPRSPLEPLI
jgi:hypothetical protein